MSLGIAFKGAEGIVLAADSRVTLLAQIQPAGQPAGQPGQQQLVVPASFDNATKLLRVSSQTHVAAVTYGAGAIGLQAPRTASSFMPEFDVKLTSANIGRLLSVQELAQKLSDFFMRQWTSSGMPVPVSQGQDMVFLVAGYDDPAAAYGRIFEVFIPSRPAPNELLAGQFGAAWGGQREYTDRILQGFDPQLPRLAQAMLNLPDDRTSQLETDLKNRLTIPIPWQFLPLQDCVDLCIFLVRATVTLQKWMVSIRGVGGAIDVATITRTEGFKPIQEKQITGERMV